MSDKVVQYGPFTPQELDLFVKELQLKNIPFEIHKDDDAEKKFSKSNDFSNIVNLAEFRTDQYLAQIFYITLARKDVGLVSARLEQLGFPATLPEQTNRELDEDDGTDRFVRTEAKKQNFQKRMVATVLVIGLICMILATVASILFEANPI